jgi:hypothetical protein
VFYKSTFLYVLQLFWPLNGWMVFIIVSGARMMGITDARKEQQVCPQNATEDKKECFQAQSLLMALIRPSRLARIRRANMDTQ